MFVSVLCSYVYLWVFTSFFWVTRFQVILFEIYCLVASSCRCLGACPVFFLCSPLARWGSLDSRFYQKVQPLLLLHCHRLLPIFLLLRACRHCGQASLQATNPLNWTALTWAALRGRAETTRCLEGGPEVLLNPLLDIAMFWFCRGCLVHFSTGWKGFHNVFDMGATDIW